MRQAASPDGGMIFCQANSVVALPALTKDLVHDRNQQDGGRTVHESDHNHRKVCCNEGSGVRKQVF